MGSEPAARAIAPGVVVDDRFEVERDVASGGMGRILLARDRLTSEPVALKVVLLDDEDAERRFTREAVALAEVRHPGVVRYVAHGKTPSGERYLAMEWLEGRDLSALLRERRASVAAEGGDATVAAAPDAHPKSSVTLGSRTVVTGLSVADVLVIGRRIAGALGELHQRGVVHRDVKPSNLFLVDEAIDKVKLLDLGAARLSQSHTRLTMSGALVGTPAYMAPEQARAEEGVGPPTDVWALGCVLYECLTLRPPFTGGSLLAILAKILLEDPIPLRTLRPDVPAVLDELLRRMLAKDASHRPDDGGAVLDALAALAHTSGSDAPPTTSSVPPRSSALGAAEQRVSSLVLVSGVPQERGSTLTAAVERLGGSVLALPDGSLLATTPPGDAPVDQAIRAARIALALRAEVPTLRLALVTGRSGAGDKTLGGRAAHRATQTLEDAASGEIRLDELTAALLDARFELESAGDAPRLVRERSTEATRTLLGRPSRWVGRKREIATLMATFEECAEDGVARAVLVTGPPGMGKSRLRHELVVALRERREPLLLLHGQGDAMSAGSPFVMIAPAIRRAVGITEYDAPAARQKKLLLRVAGVAPAEDAQRVAEFLGELVGAAFPESDALRAARADPMLMADRTRAAWEEWLTHETARQPVVLILEDLHWGDPPSARLVDGALRVLANRSLFVLALARPEVAETFPRLWEGRGLQEIPLGPLAPRAATELVTDALGDGVKPEVVQAIVERAEGNAFYLEELIRVVAENAAVKLPDSVVGMVQSRLDALGTEARRVLRAASVFGEVFSTEGVRALLGGDSGAFDVKEWLDDLSQKEIVSRRAEPRLARTTEYSFRHALVRDAAYALLTDEDRLLGHRLAAAWLEGAGEVDPLVLAEHHLRGDALEGAARWFHRAAEQALEGSDLGAAIERAQRAVDAGAAGRELGALRTLQSTALYWQSDYAGAARRAAEAAELVDPGGADWFRAKANAIVSSARLGDTTGVDRHFDEALASECASGAEAARLVCLCRGTFQLVFAARFEQADRALERIASLAAEAPSVDALTSAQVSHVQGVRAAHVGDVATFKRHLEAAVESFERAGDARNVSLERTTVAWCWAELGLFDEAERLCRASLDHCERIGAQQALTYARVNLGYILTHRDGKLDEAERTLEDAIAECHTAGNPRLEGWARAHLTAVAHLRGRHAVEHEHARAAATLLAVSPGLQSWALATWARACLATGEPEAALRHARESFAILGRLGGLLQRESLPPLVLAEALHASGDVAAARAAILDATARLERRTARLPEPWRGPFLALADHRRTVELRRAWGAG